ncbi:unnamed protein product [Malus baccata var. baccata]
MEKNFNAKFVALIQVSSMLNAQEACIICNETTHDITQCPNKDSYPELVQENLNMVNNFIRPRTNPHSNTYNPGWKNHPNLSWVGNHQRRQYQQSFQSNSEIKKPSLEDQMLQLAQHMSALSNSTNNFVQSTQSSIQNLTASVGNLETQVGQLATMFNEREKGKFPSQLEKNPRGMEHCKVIRTLRSGKSYHNREVMHHEAEGEEQKLIESAPLAVKSRSGAISAVGIPDPSTSDKVQSQPKFDVNKKNGLGSLFAPSDKPPLPFPQRQQQRSKDQQYIEFMKTLAKVQINLPLLDAIKQIPSYAKFLKELCSKKKKFLEYEKAGRSSLLPRTLIDVEAGTLTLRGESVVFKLFEAIKHPLEPEECFCVNVLDGIVHANFASRSSNDELLTCLTNHDASLSMEENVVDFIAALDSAPIHNPKWQHVYESLGVPKQPLLPSSKQAPKLELKLLPSHLKYAHLGVNKTLPVIIAVDLSDTKEEKLLRVLRKYQDALGWTPADIKGISPALCMHRIFMEARTKPIIEAQRYLNLIMKKVLRVEVMKLLDAGYNQIPITPEDQEKTTFTCPFSGMVENIVKVFMDDFCVFSDSFDICLDNLSLILERCSETNLVLNWEKCHFMVKHGIVLRHLISSKRIEVDKARIEVITNLPPPTSVKSVRSFLGHAGFYLKFMKDFSKISHPLGNLLAKYATFDFDAACHEAFNKLKDLLTSAPIITALNWALSFELMCNDSDYAMGVVLGQRSDKLPHVIYYASCTLHYAQLNYATMEKELLVVVFALEKFRSYLISAKLIVYWIILL